MPVEKKGRGRPKKAIKADAHLKLRLTQDEKNEWIKKAERSGLTLSQWLRQMVINHG